MNDYAAVTTAVIALQNVQEEIRSCYQRDENGHFTHPLSVAHREEMQAAYKTLHPRRKFDWVKAREVLPEIEARHAEIGSTYTKDLVKRREEAENALRGACESVPVEQGEEWREIGLMDGGTWHTQGFGANKYARNAAEALAEKARSYEVEAEVREVARHHVRRERLGSETYITYGVYAKVTELGATILECKPDIPLRERVRLAWKRGANPRVDELWWLPADYEEKEGLDYFGNDLTAQEARG